MRPRLPPTRALHRRPLSSTALSRPLQSYISHSTHPPTNLSLEQHLLRTTPPSSHILLLYTNTPSVILGRNQNPWREAHLHALARAHTPLLRRRSGGGTVVHDLGNVNWSVIVPAAAFTRDKHVEMVVRALRSLGVERARVNARHDVVLDDDTVAVADPGADAADTHRTRWTAPMTPTAKVSGSAYKLTRGRALHHGTCLLASPALARIGALLRSPARDLLDARGVDSVSSTVANVGVDTQAFMAAVRAEFARLYGETEVEGIGDEDARDERVQAEISEMAAPAWVFGQTPLFRFAGEGVGRGVVVEARQGVILGVEGVDARVVGLSLAGSWTWAGVLGATGVAGYLDQMLPTAGTLGLA